MFRPRNHLGHHQMGLKVSNWYKRKKVYTWLNLLSWCYGFPWHGTILGAMFRPRNHLGHHQMGLKVSNWFKRKKGYLWLNLHSWCYLYSNNRGELLDSLKMKVWGLKGFPLVQTQSPHFLHGAAVATSTVWPAPQKSPAVFAGRWWFTWLLQSPCQPPQYWRCPW